MVLVSLFDPATINGLIDSQKAMVILGVPTMVVGLVEEQENDPIDAGSLELVSS